MENKHEMSERIFDMESTIRQRSPMTDKNMIYSWKGRYMLRCRCLCDVKTMFDLTEVKL